jgi:hypothetical protein
MSFKHLSALTIFLVACVDQGTGPSGRAHNADAADVGDASPGRPHDAGSSDAEVLPDGCVVQECDTQGNEHFNPASCACEPCATSDECTDGKVCLNGTGCVECTAEDASACEAHGKLCSSEGTNTCVECNVSTDCKDAGKPVCSNHECAPCTQDSECETRSLICDESGPLKGQCVKCTVDPTDELRCGEFSCNPATNECTDHKRGSVDICEPCFADSECKENHACIPLFFGENSEPQGGYCMRVKSSTCVLPYGASPIKRASLSGAAEKEYCGINESITSCAAIKALEAATSCVGGDPLSCAASGALCQSVNGIDDLCTYACTLSTECPSGAACRGPDSAKYCGGPT